MNGELVSSEQWAETTAEYLEKVQWAVRPIQPLQQHSRLGPNLPVDVGAVSEDEAVHAGTLLNKNRASGKDDIPPEFWKTIAST